MDAESANSSATFGTSRAMASAAENGALRQLEPHWNHGMIVASVAIALLGAFTSTQLYVTANSASIYPV